ncbi:MAG: BamA/TamA family outer membrane protein [Chitinivibrionales bacterium]|nr:BamA/TamA family outer membrane protein [Chitinivibrionales bacterium]MBD3355685.1 BamA/TamA family outer membrane protein [Chitinivibrionales bacterium]
MREPMRRMRLLHRYICDQCICGARHTLSLRRFCFITLGIMLPAVTSYARQSDTAILVDSIPFPEVRRAREPWEYVLSVPGWLIGAPFIITTEAIAGTYRFLHRQETLQRILSLIFVVEDTTVILAPAYSSRTGLGVSYRKKGIWRDASELEITGTYGTRNRHGFELSMNNTFPFALPMNYSIGVDYEYIPDRSFFGIGPDNAEDDETRFGLATIDSELMTAAAPKDYLRTAAGIQFDKVFIFESKHEDEPATQEVFDTDRLPGFKSGGLFLGPGVGLELDFRANRHRPTGGLWVVIGGALVWELTGERLSYWTTGTDMRLYLAAPWFGDRVFVLRSAYATVHGLGGGSVPLFALSKFSGEGTVRGYTTARFRDNEMLILSAEYRYLIWENVLSKVDAVAFVDAGQVQEHIFAGAKWDDFRLGVGGGLRIHDDQVYLGSIMAAFGKDEFRLTVDVGW